MQRFWAKCARRKLEEALSRRSPFGESLAGRREHTTDFMLLSFGVEIRSCDRLEVGETRKSGHFSIIAEDLEKALGIIPVHNYFHYG